MKTILGVNLYDIREVAELLSVTTTTIHNYIKSGSLDARKIGGRWYIAEETIKLFVSGSNNASAGKRS